MSVLACYRRGHCSLGVGCSPTPDTHTPPIFSSENPPTVVLSGVPWAPGHWTSFTLEEAGLRHPVATAVFKIPRVTLWTVRPSGLSVRLSQEGSYLRGASVSADLEMLYLCSTLSVSQPPAHDTRPEGDPCPKPPRDGG